MARTVVAPDSAQWRVGRQWLPFRVRIPRRKMRDGDGNGVDLFDFGFLDAPGAVGAILVMIAIAIIVVLFIWPIVAIALEAVILALIFVVALAGRVVFRRPWTITARRETPAHGSVEHVWKVSGWLPSRRLITTVSIALEQGTELPGTNRA